MKFSYKRYGRDTLRPVIPVEVLHEGRAIQYEVLVDSGADTNIFDAEIGALAGIDVVAGKPCTLGGVTGTAETFYMHTVTLAVGGTTFRTKVGFLHGMTRFGYGVVGQKGFFDTFIVKFALLKKKWN